MGTGVAACVTGGLWYRCDRGRSKITNRLMDEARPVLDVHALSEQEKLPVEAEERIKSYFDSICLHTGEFIGEISTPDFRRKLSKIRAADRRHHELMAAFCRRVPDANLIGDHVHIILADIGRKLDSDWTECCREISGRWNVWFRKEDQPTWDADEFSRRVTPLLEYQVEQAARQAHKITDESAWRANLRSLGAEALEANEEVSFDLGGRTIRVPEFAVAASRRVFGNLVDLLGDPKWDCQAAITGRFAALGNQTAGDFKKLVRRRLNDLQIWREQAVRLTAEQQAAERIGFFGAHG
jgi:hypothetical protein